jgi:hypothetical protein
MRRFVAFIFGLVAAFRIGSIAGFRLNRVTTRRSFVAQSTTKGDREVGGIYEYTGKGVPPEMAKAFGLRSRDAPDTEMVSVQPKKASKAKKAGGKAGPKKGKGNPDDRMSVDDLEKQVRAKYGGKVYKETLKVAKEEEEKETQRRYRKGGKFDGFGAFEQKLKTPNKKLKSIEQNAKVAQRKNRKLGVMEKLDVDTREYQVDEILDVDTVDDDNEGYSFDDDDDDDWMDFDDDDDDDDDDEISRQPTLKPSRQSAKSAAVESTKKPLLLGRIQREAAVRDKAGGQSVGASRSRDNDYDDDDVDWDGIERYFDDDDAYENDLYDDEDRAQLKGKQRRQGQKGEGVGRFESVKRSASSALSAPQTSMGGFRLRAPPPPSAEEIRKREARAAAEAGRER